MATALEKEDTEHDYQILTCTLCKEELKKPKLLACQHSFCTQCLVQQHDTNDEGKPFCCPTCQREIKLVDDTIESIPNNYLYDIVKEADGHGLDSAVKCTPCNEGNKASNATHKCLDCRDTLCQHCSEYHCRLTVTKHHVVVALADLQKGKFQDEFSKRKVLNCNLHSMDEQTVLMSSYCDTCKCLVCVDCTQGDHKKHSFSKIQSVREKHHRSRDEDISVLQRSEKDQDKKMNNVKKAVTDTKQKWSQQETEIYDTATELYTIVDKIKDEKLTELKTHYEKELKYLDQLLNEERHKQISLQATVAFTKMFVEKCSDSDFLYHENDIKNRMELSKRERSHIFKRNLVFIEKQNTQSISQAMKNVFGRIVRKEHQYHHKCKIGQVKEKFKRKIDMHSIFGIAFDTHDKKILVSGNGLHEKSQRINVLDENGIQRRIIRCKDSNESFGIDVNMNTTQICFTTYHPNSRKVTIIDRYGIAQKSMILPDDDQDTIFPLEVLIFDDNTIFIASCIMDRIYKWDLQEDKLTTIISQELGGTLRGPLYLCRTPEDQLVVSNPLLSNIQVYSKEGELQWQYGVNKEENALKSPSGVCCDEDGYIYVADNTNCRIQVIHDKKLVGNIPIDKTEEEAKCLPLILAPDGDLIYGYKNNLKKISFWE